MTLASLLVTAIALVATPQQPPVQVPYRQWAQECTDRIRADFWLSDRHLYADKVDREQPAQARQPAFMWGCGVMLTALDGAAAVDRKHYAAQLNDYLNGLRRYWLVSGDVGGFDVLPGASTADRYYDDNAWMTLALVDAYRVLRQRDLLDWAEQTQRFVVSGEDSRLGGGLYWHEQDRASKNTCSNAPAIVGALELYRLTHREAYLDSARRLYDWVNAHLQDRDGLYWDHIDLSGSVERTKWSYNSALMLRANLLFFQIYRDTAYLREAERIAASASALWVDPETGATRNPGPFAHLLCDAYLRLYGLDRRSEWLTTVERAAQWVHDRVCDPDGHYPADWGKPCPSTLTRYGLLDQASAARLYWLLAARRIG